MRFADVMALLEAHKGDGTWQRVARDSGIHYDTVARIARGKMKTPSVQTVEKLAAALLREVAQDLPAVPEPASEGA